MNILLFLIIILFFIVFIGIINEKFFHIQGDIALILFSLVIALILAVISRFFSISALERFVSNRGEFGFEEYLMDGVLCFMLFAGASKVNMGKFKQNLRPISLLALLTTLVSSFLYGLMFFAVACIFKIPMDIWMCILLGCVVSPTDPIAATGILNKIGLSKNVCSVIENESLFNDGTGVTLFIFVRSIIIESGEGNFVQLMFKEIVGAVAVALAAVVDAAKDLLLVTVSSFDEAVTSSANAVPSAITGDISFVLILCVFFGIIRTVPITAASIAAVAANLAAAGNIFILFFPLSSLLNSSANSSFLSGSSKPNASARAFFSVPVI